MNVGCLFANYDSVPRSLESAFLWVQMEELGTSQRGETASFSPGAEKAGRRGRREVTSRKRVYGDRGLGIRRRLDPRRENCLRSIKTARQGPGAEGGCEP